MEPWFHYAHGYLYLACGKVCVYKVVEEIKGL